MNYAYLHGFASSPQSEKGQQLAEMFAGDGIELHLPDLNEPSFEELTYSNMVEAMQAYDREYGDGEPWRLIGSSMGGYVAARWAQIAPGKVDRMVLLCPGFNMVERWGELLGQQGIDPEDSLSAIHWELYADADENHPAYPEVDCPAIVVHGADDDIVLMESSEKFVDQTDGAELRVVDDNHKLHESVDEIYEAARELFEL